MAKRRLLTNFDFESLSSVVDPGCYAAFDDPDDVPGSLKPFSGYVERDKFGGLIVMASQEGQGATTIGGLTPDVNFPVYRIRTRREDRHDEEPHMNADDVLVFRCGDGQVAKVSNREQPQHYVSLSTATGLDASLEQFPSKPRGLNSELPIVTNFSTGPHI